MNTFRQFITLLLSVLFVACASTAQHKININPENLIAAIDAVANNNPMLLGKDSAEYFGTGIENPKNKVNRGFVEKGNTFLYKNEDNRMSAYAYTEANTENLYIDEEERSILFQDLFRIIRNKYGNIISVDSETNYIFIEIENAIVLAQYIPETIHFSIYPVLPFGKQNELPVINIDNLLKVIDGMANDNLQHDKVENNNTNFITEISDRYWTDYHHYTPAIGLYDYESTYAAHQDIPGVSAYFSIQTKLYYHRDITQKHFVQYVERITNQLKERGIVITEAPEYDEVWRIVLKTEKVVLEFYYKYYKQNEINKADEEFVFYDYMPAYISTKIYKRIYD